jgi:hypothetical protein
MSSLARLIVTIGANSAALQKELRKAQTHTSKFVDNTRKKLKSLNMAGVAGVLSGAGVVTGLQAIYREQAQVIDQTAKFADRIGISTEALSGLRWAGELTGVSQKNLDMALQRSTRRIAQAATGSGEAVKALNELGLSATDLSKLMPDQQLHAVADAMTGVKNQSDRVRLAFALFDSEGVGMVNTLAGGSAALKAMHQEAETLGIVLNRVDANKVEMANDSIARSSTVWGAFKMHLTTGLAPIINALSDGFVNAAKDAGGLHQYTKEMIRSMVKGVGYLGNAWRGIEVIIQTLKLSYAGLKLGFVEFVNWFPNLFVKAANEVNLKVLDMVRSTLAVLAQYSDTAADLLNKLPTFKPLPPLEVVGEDTVTKAYADVAQAKQNLHDLAMKPIPSTAIEQWYNEASAKFEQAAQNYTKTINYNQPQSDNNQQQANKYAAMAQREQEFLALREMMKANSWTQERAQLQMQVQEYTNALAQRAISEQDYITLSQAAWEKYAQKREQQSARISDFERQQQIARAQSEAGTFASNLQNLAQYNSKYAGVAKKAAIAQATIKTYESATSAFSALAGIPIVGPILGGVAAAAAVMAGLANVAAIKNQPVGMAHSGIDYVPSEGTWLLDKGERVYTNASVKKLDAMHDQIMRQGGPASQGAAQVNFNVSALDTNGFDDWYESNRNRIASDLSDLMLQPM